MPGILEALMNYERPNTSGIDPKAVIQALANNPEAVTAPPAYTYGMPVDAALAEQTRSAQANPMKDAAVQKWSEMAVNENSKRFDDAVKAYELTQRDRQLAIEAEKVENERQLAPFLHMSALKKEEQDAQKAQFYVDSLRSIGIPIDENIGRDIINTEKIYYSDIGQQTSFMDNASKSEFFSNTSKFTKPLVNYLINMFSRHKMAKDQATTAANYIASLITGEEIEKFQEPDQNNSKDLSEKPKNEAPSIVDAIRNIFSSTKKKSSDGNNSSAPKF